MDIKQQRILITRPTNQAEAFMQKLSALGAEPIAFPVIEISPITDTTELDRALSRLHSYNWLALTSANGVHAVWSRLNALAIASLPENLRIAAVGPKTAAALREHSVVPNFVPEKYVGEAILPGLGDLRGQMVLLPSADIARDALPKMISAADGIAHVIVAYHTIPAVPNAAGVAALQKGVDLVTFTSPSTVRNFIALVEQIGLDPLSLPGKPRFACIGPITADAAKAENMPVHMQAKEFSVNGLILAILEYQVKHIPSYEQ